MGRYIHYLPPIVVHLDIEALDEALCDVKLMYDKVHPFLCRYLQRFWSYLENPGEGQILPPSGARVNHYYAMSFTDRIKRKMSAYSE